MRNATGTAEPKNLGSGDTTLPRRAGVLAATAALWLVAQFAFWPGHTLNATRFIYYDQGSFLYVVDCLERGEALYRDVAWQYGPLAIAWFAAWAKILGNSPVTLVLASGAAMAIVWATMVELAGRVIGFVRAWIGGVLVLLPLMTHLLVRGYNNGPHAAVEAMGLAALAVLLARPARDWRGAVAVGVLLGALQLVRFGPHLVAGAVVGALWAASMPGRSGRERGASLAIIGGAYALVFVGYAAWLRTRLPDVAVVEQLWPSFMVGHYRETFANHAPPAIDAWELSVRWVPAGLALGSALVVLVGGFRRGARSALEPRRAALCLFPLYLLLAGVVLFRSRHHVAGHLWLVWAALPLAWTASRRAVRVAAAVATLAVAIGNIGEWSGYLRNELTSDVAPRTLPNGQRLWFLKTEERIFGALETVFVENPIAKREGRRPRVAVMVAGGGVYYFFALQRPEGRHWWFLPSFVRPWEEERIAASLRACDLFLPFWSGNGRIFRAAPPPEGIALWFPVSSAHVGDLPERLIFERWIPGAGSVFRVQPPR